MTTSDQERAAPAQQPVDLLTIVLTILAQRGIPTDVQELLVSGDPMSSIKPSALTAAIHAAAKRLASSEPELRAEIVSLTRERDFEQSSRLTREAQLGAQIENLIRELDEHRRVRDVYVVSSQEEYIARCRAEQERDELQKRVEALSAEVGTARAAAFEEAAQIADEHARNAWEIAVSKGEDDICASGRNYGARDIASAIRSRAALDKGATR